MTPPGSVLMKLSLSLSCARSNLNIICKTSTLQSITTPRVRGSRRSAKLKKKERKKKKENIIPICCSSRKPDRKYGVVGWWYTVIFHSCVHIVGLRVRENGNTAAEFIIFKVWHARKCKIIIIKNTNEINILSKLYQQNNITQAKVNLINLMSKVEYFG